MNDNNQIVGFHNPGNGWSCNQDDFCGLHVWPGNLIHLKREVMEVINQQEGDPEPDASFETVIKIITTGNCIGNTVTFK
jgi:hypothetical protein